MWRHRVKSIGRRLGVEISRHHPTAAGRVSLMKEFGIGTVLDVGANVGGYALGLRYYGYRERIISFEPLAAAYEALSAAARNDPVWDCHRFALGESDTRSRLDVASNSASSSLLRMLDTHRRAVPDVSIVGSELVEVRTLDSLELALDTPTLMKLDVQGYEDRVLRGAAATLSKVDLIECELSLLPLYESQRDLLEMLNLLDDFGFRLFALEPTAVRDCARTGRMLQYDALLARGEAEARRQQVERSRSQDVEPARRGEDHQLLRG